jgi:hypothetical protein
LKPKTKISSSSLQALNFASLFEGLEMKGLQESILSTFYAQNFLPIFWRQKIAKPNVIREKLLNLLLYKKSLDVVRIGSNWY